MALTIEMNVVIYTDNCNDRGSENTTDTGIFNKDEGCPAFRVTLAMIQGSRMFNYGTENTTDTHSKMNIVRQLR